MNPLKQARLFYNARTQWLGAGGQPSEHAQARANVCLECPHNQASPVEEALKGAAAAVVRRQIEVKGKLKLEVVGEEGLHLCDLCGCVLPLKVHVPLEIARANTPDWRQLMPPMCWLHNDDLT